MTRLTGSYENMFGRHCFIRGNKTNYNARSFDNVNESDIEIIQSAINKLYDYESLEEKNNKELERYKELD